MKHWAKTAIVVVGCALMRVPGAAAQEAVYAAEELTERPQLASPGKAALLISQAYPQSLRDAGVTGTVQITFVVDAAGKVEPESVRVVMATAPALGDVAKKLAPKLEFKPGKKAAQAVRSQVILPVVFR